MNKYEAIKTIESMGGYERFVDEPISKASVLNIVNQINVPKKPRVPQVAVDFYERYKDDDLDLGEWFSDFYSDNAIEDFPRMEELAEWLHDNDNETNRQREYALATLITFGPDSVEVEKEPLGVLLVDMPEPYFWEYSYLYKRISDKYDVGYTDDPNTILGDMSTVKVTEAEAKEKYPIFRWVSLEELENDQSTEI